MRTLPPSTPHQPLAPSGTSWVSRVLGALGAVAASWLLSHHDGAHAQMVPHAEHALHQAQSRAITEARLNWGSVAPMGKGLSLNDPGLWPHWEGRIGAVIDRPVDPLKDSFVLTQPNQQGLRLRSLHLLSDYYLDGGFRATAGIVRGETGQAWWSTGERGGGLNLSLQRVDTLSLGSTPGSDASSQQTTPYVGAGYSTRLDTRGAVSAWRFNADLGIITINSSNINRISQVIMGDKPLDTIARDLRLRPVIKVSVGYAF